MRVGFVEWPEGLEAGSAVWSAISEEIEESQMDLLVTNELPFGQWVAAHPMFDKARAEESIASHERGLEALKKLPVNTIVTSRPIWADDRLANEAFVLEQGRVSSWRRKQFFPQEVGWYEAAWFGPGLENFSVVDTAGAKIGVLLCTEAMYNERARVYGLQGAQLIVIPRATGASTIWPTAAAMTAIISGCFVISSNRSGSLEPTGSLATFGGEGFAYAPDGAFIARTSPTRRLVVIDFDLNESDRSKEQYPCYVFQHEAARRMASAARNAA